MVDLKLSEEERDTLDAVLHDYLSDLRMEIADTDSADYRDQLKRRKEILLRVVEALTRATA